MSASNNGNDSSSPCRPPSIPPETLRESHAARAARIAANSGGAAPIAGSFSSPSSLPAPPPPPRPPRNVGGPSSSPSASSLGVAASASGPSSSSSSQPPSSIRNMAAQLNGRININPAAQPPQRPKSAVQPVSDNKENKLDPKKPPVWIRAGVFEQKTMDLWNKSGADEALLHTFIGITRIDNGMMYARPCFYQIFDQLFLLNGQEAKENIQGLYGDDYVTITMTPDLLLKKIDTKLAEESVSAEDKIKFTKVKTDLEAAGKITEQKARKEAQIAAMVPVIKDNALQRHLIDGMGHQALAYKIRPIELKHIPPERRQLMRDQPIHDSIVLGWAIKGSLAYLKLVDNAQNVQTENLEICAFSSGRNTDKFDNQHRDRHLPKKYALETMYALNAALVMTQKFKHPTIKLLPPSDIKIYEKFPVDKLKNENILETRKKAFEELAAHLAQSVDLARSPGALPPQPQSASGPSSSQSALSLGGAAPASVSSSSSSSPPLSAPPMGAPPIAGRSILGAIVSAEARGAAPAQGAAPPPHPPRAEIPQVPSVMLDRVRALEQARRAPPVQQDPPSQRSGPCGPGQPG